MLNIRALLVLAILAAALTGHPPVDAAPADPPRPAATQGHLAARHR